MEKNTSKNQEPLVANVLFARNLVMNLKNVVFRCTRCKIPNHSKQDCWYRDKQEKNDANFVKDSQEDELFYTCMSVEHETQDTWFLDN